MKGRLIVLEGIDGSGKRTQAERLRDAMNANGYPAVVVSFPGYDTTYAGVEIRAYLDGRYGELSPKLAALLYAVDRFEQLPMLKTRMKAGLNVICDRYLPSNIAHQGARAGGDRQALVEWIRLVETEVFGVLEPDLSILLSVHPLKTQEMMGGRVLDLHERDRDHLLLAHSIYEELAEQPAWVKVDCMAELTTFNHDCNGDLVGSQKHFAVKSVEEIAKMIRDAIAVKLDMELSL